MSGKRSAESRFKEFPYRVGNAKWKWKWQLEAFTDVGKLPVPGAGQAVPWGSGGWAGVWRLRRGPSSLLKEEEKLRCGGRRKQGCEEDSRHVLAWRRWGVQQREAVWKFLLSGPVLVCWGCVHPGCSHRRPEPGWLMRNRSLSLMVLKAGKVQVQVLTDSRLVRARFLCPYVGKG